MKRNEFLKGLVFASNTEDIEEEIYDGELEDFKKEIQGVKDEFPKTIGLTIGNTFYSWKIDLKMKEIPPQKLKVKCVGSDWYEKIMKDGKV